MTIVSVIIVNYNVKHFIRQCLQSLLHSKDAEHLEIIVVDNNSSDGSVSMLQREFPEVKLIVNSENLGFSKAVNQGFELVTGKYCLLLNPDTIVEEDTISRAVQFIQSDPRIGAVGVKMMDGSGTYLPESKRGFPSPGSAFFKMTGISRLFPSSAFYNHYYMGHLDKDETNEVEVLTGAFFLAPTGLLRKIGGLDEDYFMYGEDIELSYQVAQMGYKIMYYPAVRIIHFKGESTDKSSLKYIRNFYGAMQKYAQKRNRDKGLIWRMLIPVGIVMSAVSGMMRNILALILRPLADIAILLLAGKGLTWLWANFYYGTPDYYAAAPADGTILVAVIVLVLGYYLFGQYDRRHNIKHLIYGFAIASLLMFTVYGLLPEHMRFSRLVLLSIALIAPGILFLTRKLYNKWLYRTYKFDGYRKKRVGIVGSGDSFEKVKRIFDTSAGDMQVQHIDSKTVSGDSDTSFFINMVHAHRINELVFCSRDMKTQEIFEVMSGLGDNVSFKVANNDNTGILGSDSKDRAGEWYTHEIAFKIDQKFHRRLKRLLDLALWPVFIILAPLAWLTSRDLTLPWRKLPGILTGRYTWVGYDRRDTKLHTLPSIKNNVYPVPTEGGRADQEIIHALNTHYARNYTLWIDLHYFFKSFLGRKKQG